MIDHNIPLVAGQAGNSLAGVYQRYQDRQLQEQQMQMQQQRMKMQQRQLDLQERAMLDQMDQRQREAAKEGIKDMVGAIQWIRQGQSPQEQQMRLEQAKQAYAQHDPAIANVTLDQLDGLLMKFGLMGEYLDATQPSNDATSFGKDLAMLGIDPRSEEAKRIFYAKNSPPGYMLQPGGGSQSIPTVNSPDEARALGPGAVFKTPDGRVMRVPGGAGGNVSGGF